MARMWKQEVLQILVTCGTNDMASSKTTPIFFADGAADTMTLSVQTEFRVGLGRRADEMTNYSDLSPLNFRLLCSIHLYVCH